MEIQDKSLYCDRCIHKATNIKEELICSLTKTHPYFGETCYDFEISKPLKNEKVGFEQNKSIDKIDTSSTIIIRKKNRDNYYFIYNIIFYLT